MTTGFGKRKHKRILTALPVRLWGMDANGRPFLEVSRTENVSRTGALLKGVPAKLVIGDVIGLRCNEKKYNFRVVWVGKQGTTDAGSVGLQSVEPEKWIWEGLHIPADDTDIYTRSPEQERRQLKRVRCLVSAEVLPNGQATQKVLVFVSNISKRGCYIPLPYPYPLKTVVSIALWLEEGRKIWVDGIVLSSHPQAGMGVKFVGVTQRNAEAIEAFIDGLSKSENASLKSWSGGQIG